MCILFEYSIPRIQYRHTYIQYECITLSTYPYSYVVTLGTACSGTDAPVFMLRGLTQTLIKQHNGVREMKHVFSSEHDKDKRDWITTVCNCDNDFANMSQRGRNELAKVT